MLLQNRPADRQHQEHAVDAQQHPMSGANSAVTPLKKRAAPALLSAHKTPTSTGHHAGSTEETPAASDCAEASHAVCFHPSHSLASLLDAAHWGVQLLLDDGVGARWPLQLSSHAFRRILRMLDGASSSGASSLLHDSWLSLLDTGEVACPLSPSMTSREEVLFIALTQMRKHTFHHVLALFNMDETRRLQHLADFMSVASCMQHTCLLPCISLLVLMFSRALGCACVFSMLTLSHSAVVSADSCLSAVSDFLSCAAPEWQRALGAEAATGSLAMDVDALPVRVETAIVASLAGPDAVHVELKLTGSQLPHAADDEMQDAAAASEQRPPDEVILTAEQLEQLRQLLAAAHGPGEAPAGAASEWQPLLFFLPSEWSALCAELCSVLHSCSLHMELAECERHAPSAPVRAIQPQGKRVTSAQFRSVFIPRVDLMRLK